MPWAADSLRLVPIVERAEVVIDRRPEKTYAGPCDICRRDLYVDPGQATVVCEHCGIGYDLAARRTWLLSVAYDRLATATETARALSTWELPVSDALIRQWAHRGRLAVRGHDRTGAAMYRIGDVVERLAKQRETGS
jgi:hypothetical protein